MSDPLISDEDLDLAEEEARYIAHWNSCKAPAPGFHTPGKYQARRCHRASGHTGAHVSGTRRNNDQLVWPGDDE
jgi:hypothetical protein